VATKNSASNTPMPRLRRGAWLNATLLPILTLGVGAVAVIAMYNEQFGLEKAYHRMFPQWNRARTHTIVWAGAKGLPSNRLAGKSKYDHHSRDS
jgi:hypothetical protein